MRGIINISKILYIIVSNVLMPLTVAYMSIKLTTEHERKIKMENFKISAYVMYEEVREWIGFYNKLISEDRTEKMGNNYVFNFKDILNQFNYFVKNKSDKLTLKEVKALLELEDFIIQLFKIDKNIKQTSYREMDIYIYRLDAQIELIDSALNKIYNFIDSTDLQPIKLYKREEILKLKVENLERRKDYLKEEIEEIEKKLGESVDKTYYYRCHNDYIAFKKDIQNHPYNEESQRYSQYNLNMLYQEYFQCLKRLL